MTTRDRFRVAHVSDTHLAAANGRAPTTVYARRRERARCGWEWFVEQVRRDPPDLVVHTGDVILDEPDDVADHEHARSLLNQLPVPVLAVPGNHDVGDRTHRSGLPPKWLGTPISAARCARWRFWWGADRWARDIGEWTLLGVNSLLMGSGLPDEEPQWRWLEDRAASARRAVAVFLHEAPSPALLGMAPDSWAGIPPSAQRRVAALLLSRPVRLVGSGHVHRFHVARSSGTTYVTTPSLASAIPERFDMTQPNGDPRPGFVRYTFEPGGVLIDPCWRDPQ